MASQPPTYLSGFGSFLPTYTSPHFLPTTLRSDHVKQIPTTQGARGCHLGLECGHRRNESRKGNLDHRARQGRFWFRQRCPYNDQSGFPSAELLLADCRLKYD